MREVRSDPMVEVATVDGRDTGATDGLTLTLRPRLVFRLLGPVLFGIGALAMAAGVVAGALLIAIGLALLVVWLPRVAVDERELRLRGVLHNEVIPLSEIDEVRLRRVAFGPKRPSGRNYRFGRFCSIPMRLRVLHEEDTVGQITVVFWEGWPKLVRYLLLKPEIHSESRTRGRLDRYG